jgi:hypothetical protein
MRRRPWNQADRIAYLDVGDRLGELVEDLAADQARARQRDVDPIEGFLVGELQRLARLERAALAVGERQVAAARHADGIAARRQARDLVAAIKAGARRARVAPELRRG